MHPVPLLAAIAPTFDWRLFFSFFPPSYPLLGGLAITIYAAIAAQALGVILGILAALAAMSHSRVLRSISGAYVTFFRGTPLLVQIALLYYGTPYLLGIDLFPTQIEVGFVTWAGAILAGIMALGINEGAYMSEIVRAGILSVDPGQTEAAKSLGMTYRLTMGTIVLPQAMRVIVPPLGNEFNAMLKNTSLVSVIAVGEMFRYATSIAASTFQPFEPLLAISLYYLVLTLVWGRIQARVEARLGVGVAGERGPSAAQRLFGFRRAADEAETIRVPESGR